MDASNTLRTRTISAVLWSLVRVWGARVLSLVTFVVLSRLLQPEDVGLLAMADVLVALFAVVVVTGASQAIVRVPELSDGLLHTAFWISVTIGASLTAAAQVAAQPLADLYGEPELALVLRLLSLTLLIGSLNVVQNALLTRDLRFRDAAMRQLTAAVAGAAVGITWAVVDASVYALVAQALTWSIVSTLVVWRVGRYRPRLRFDRSEVRALAGFSVTVTGIRAFSSMGERGDNFVVGMSLGSASVGYYAVGFRIYQILEELFVGAVAAVALPAFSRVQHDLPRLRRVFLEATDASSALGIPLFVASASLSPLLVPIVFGDRWEPSVPVAQVVCAAGVFAAVMCFDRSVLIAVGRERLELAATIVAFVLRLSAVLVGQQWGIIGVAVALTAATAVWWPVRMAMLRIALAIPLREYLGQWSRTAVCGVAMYVAMAACLSFSESLWAGAVSVVAGLVTYAGALRLVAPSTFARTDRLVRRVVAAATGRSSGFSRPRPTPAPGQSPSTDDGGRG